MRERNNKKASRSLSKNKQKERSSRAKKKLRYSQGNFCRRYILVYMTTTTTTTTINKTTREYILRCKMQKSCTISSHKVIRCRCRRRHLYGVQRRHSVNRKIFYASLTRF